jgi:hypothetical protein
MSNYVDRRTKLYADIESLAALIATAKAALEPGGSFDSRWAKFPEDRRCELAVAAVMRTLRPPIEALLRDYPE